MDGLPGKSSVRAVLELHWHQKQQRVQTNRKSGSELAVLATPLIELACCGLVEVASKDSLPESDPPAWTLGRWGHRELLHERQLS